MKYHNRSIGWMPQLFLLASTACLLAGCKSSGESCDAGASAAAPAKSPPSAMAPSLPTVRIDAGSDTSFKDSAGNVWLADQGFDGGQTVVRDADLAIANTSDQGLYRTEHYDMNSFSQTIPNGKYIVKLHFAETYSEITGPGGRIFSFDVQGKNFKDFDPAAKAGGVNTAYIETVNVEVTDGKLQITFTPNVQSPEINGIEIIPAPR